ncbi:MAG TPA: tetratricopeptide repeat protein [Pyrinomonadaceae bacterium]|nr:tetratricopeptide repeat protein [Pyrinomonadaceae bacterium]
MVVRLIAPDDREIEKVENSSGLLDNLTISTTTFTSGTYRLEITSLQVPETSQSYSVFIEEQRTATKSDRDRVAAERMLMQAENFRAMVRTDSQLKAISAYEKAFEFWQRVEDPQQQAYVLNALGDLNKSLNKQQEALIYFQRALPIWRASKDTYHTASTLNSIGTVYNLRDEKRQALDAFAQSLPLWRNLGDRDNEAYTITNLAQSFAALGDNQRAIDYHNRALDIWRDINNHQSEAFTLSALGQIYSFLGDTQQALNYYSQAGAIWRTEGDPFGEQFIRLKEEQGPSAYLEGRAENRARSNANTEGMNRISLDSSSELRLWRQIETSNDWDAYYLYLRYFPAGRFSVEAKAHLGASNRGVYRRSRATGRPSRSVYGDEYHAIPPRELEAIQLAVFGNAAKNVSDAAAAIQRYPSIECPNPVVAGNNFDVLVSLSMNPVATGTLIENGKVGKDQPLELNLPSKDSWNIEVVLMAPDFMFPEGNSASLLLPKIGDSTPARFKLQSNAIQGTQQISKIYATLWYGDAYLGKIVREVKVLAAHSSLTKRAPSESQTESPKTQRESMSLSLERKSADLTVQIFESKNTGQSEIYIRSDYLSARKPEFFDSKQLSDWLSIQYNKFFQLSAQLAELSPSEAASRRSDEARDFMRGFGLELYREFCPPAFKRAFKELTEKRGQNFKTIQIFSDNFELPWELMRPINADGSIHDFLGVEFVVARWHLSDVSAELDVPPQTLPITKLIVIAPQYKEEKNLPGQQEELDTLKSIIGYERLPGQLNSVKRLFEEFPQGVVYFAGHGSILSTERKIYQYSIQLEDGQLDLLTWRGLINHQSKNHPLLFFNACEIGQTQKVANFVDGWAPAALEAGASGYIGALWPVSDIGAARFGVNFYRSLELELRNGSASVPQILMETRRKFSERADPTFLAYVYFGDANLRLRSQANKH